MPYPIAHILVGASIASLIAPKTIKEFDWKFLAAICIVACLPDFDYFFVWVLKWDPQVHRGFTHSLTFAALIWLGSIPIFRFRNAGILALTLTAHIFLDYATSPKNSGVSLFSPFSDERYGLILTTILLPEKSAYWIFWQILKELVMFTPLLIVSLIFKNGSREV